MALKTRRSITTFAALVIVAFTVTFAVAQRGRRSTPDRSEYPQWELDPQFKKDVFTFARVQFDSYAGNRFGGWRNDFPDCDWNFSVRLKELTSYEVDPNGVVVRLTDDNLMDYPFLYMSNIQQMRLTSAESDAMRSYLLNGGFIMADDIWGPIAWEHIQSEMKNVFPDREPVELPYDHPLFSMVYHLKVIPQVPSIRAWERGMTYEDWHGDMRGDTAPHFWAYLNDTGHIMALVCLNNDIGDGWEREGQSKEYFMKYSQKVSYPLGINIVTYAMTH